MLQIGNVKNVIQHVFHVLKLVQQINAFLVSLVFLIYSSLILNP